MKRIFFSLVILMAAVFTGCEQGLVVDKPEMTITPETVTVGAQSDLSAVVSVVSNRDWKVIDIPDWVMCSVNGEDIADTKMKASADPVEVTLTAKPNTGMERSAQIVFNGGAVARKALTFVQSGDVKYTSLAEVVSQMPAGSTESVTLGEGIYVKAVCIHDNTLNNLSSKKSTYVQDETAGINVYFASNSTLKFGDQVVMDLSGAKLTPYHGVIEIEGLANDKVTTIAEGVTPKAREISIDELLSDKFDCQYVSVKDVQVADADLEKTWVVSDKATSIAMVSKDGQGFVIRSSQYSSYKADAVPQGSGTVAGIATIYDGTIQLVFAQAADMAGLTGERFAIALPRTTVDDALAAAKGSSVSVLGRVIVLCPLGFIINDGTQNNLYVYQNEAPAVKVGDIVVVDGILNAYGSCVELDKPKVTASTDSVAATPEQKVAALEPSQVESYTGKSAALVSIVGDLTVVAPNINIKLEGVSIQGSLKTSDDLSAFNGKRVKATGYYIGKTSNWFNICPTEVVEDKSDYMSVSAETVKVSASETSAKFTISSNVDWTCTSQTAGFTVNPASGNGSAEVTVSFEANKDPEKEKTAVIEVSSKLGKQTVTIVQGKYVDASGLKFVKVASDLADWSGKFLIVWDAEAHATIASNSLAKTVDVTVDSDTIAYSEEVAKAIVEIAKVDGGYTVKLPSGKYLSCNANSNQATEVASAFTFSSIAVATGISGQDTGGNTRYLYKNGNYFRFYKSNSSYVVPTLYKLNGE